MTVSFPVVSVRPGAPLRVVTIPGGDAGTFATLRAMRALVQQFFRHPLITVTVANVVDPGGSAENAAQQIRAWLVEHTSFAFDPTAFNETLFTPYEQFLSLARSGFVAEDCDDVAVLGATLGKAVGLRARFVVAGFGAPAASAPFRHVYTEVWAPPFWREFDITRTPRSPRPTRLAALEV